MTGSAVDHHQQQQVPHRDDGEKRVRLLKTVGFLDAAALIIGFIIGSVVVVAASAYVTGNFVVVAAVAVVAQPCLLLVFAVLLLFLEVV